MGQKERWRGDGNPCNPSFSGRAGVKAGEPAAPSAAGSEGANAVEGTLVLGYDRPIASSRLTSPSRSHPPVPVPSCVWRAASSDLW